MNAIKTIKRLYKLTQEQFDILAPNGLNSQDHYIGGTIEAGKPFLEQVAEDEERAERKYQMDMERKASERS